MPNTEQSSKTNDLIAPSTQAGGPSAQAQRRFAASLLGIVTFVGKRLAFGLMIMLAIIFLSYLGLDMARGTSLADAAAEAVPASLSYVGRLLQGDMGLTTAGSDTLIPVPVTQVIIERVPRSFGLLGISLLFAAILGVIMGVSSARRRDRRSLGILLGSIIGISVPSFFAAFLLQWAATSYTQKVGKPLLPVGGFGWDAHLILPALVLAARPIAQITRMTFVSVREVWAQDYIRTARSKGLYRHQVLWVHVIRNAAIPILTTIGVSLRFSLSSLPVVELYFGWPGIGFTLLKGISQQDTDLTIGLSLCLGALFILVNLLLELSYRLIDPRLTANSGQADAAEKRTISQLFSELADGTADWLTDNLLVNWIKRRGTKAVQPSFQTLLVSQDLDETNETAGSPFAKLSAWTPILSNTPFIVGGLLVLALLVVILAGPNLAPNNPYTTHGLTMVDGQMKVPPFAPDEIFPWGTDPLGRDILSLVLAGARQTVGLALMVVVARILVGILLGAAAGWSSGSQIDRFILGIAEVISAFPTLLLAMILILALGIRQGIWPFVVALCFVGWGEIMQFVRSEVMALRPRPFVESATAAGARTPRIISRHILPNLFSALISLAALEMGAVLMLLGELGFISIFIGGGSFVELDTMGAPFHYSDVPEWAALLSNVRTYARSYPWTALYPTLAFFMAILSFNLFGEGIRRLVEDGSLIINRMVNKYTIALAVLAAIALTWIQANSGPITIYQRSAETFDGERALSSVAALTDPAWEGRGLGTPGIDAAAHYIADQFESLGLQPAGQGLTYFFQRPRDFERILSVPTFTIEDQGPPPVYGVDFVPYAGPLMTMGEITAPVRVVRLGSTPPQARGGSWRAFPDLRTADYSDEVLLVLSERDAFILGREVPLGGMLVVTDNQELMGKRFTLSGRSAASSLGFGSTREGKDAPSFWISEELADRLLQGSGHSLSELQAQIPDLGFAALNEIPLSKEVSLKVDGVQERRFMASHVIGHLPGSAGVSGEQKLDDRLIVVLAQYDSPPPGPEDEPYPAANDNASGVAVMLEAIRILQESDYEPYRTFLFVAYSGEGMEGGEIVSDPDVGSILQAKIGFASAYELEAVIHLRGLGGGSGDRVELSAGGSLRLAEMFEMAAKKVGTDVVRADESIDIGIIYELGTPFQSGQEAPELRLFWEGWQQTSHTSSDQLANISAANLEDAGRALSMALMILGRETQY